MGLPLCMMALVACTAYAVHFVQAPDMPPLEQAFFASSQFNHVNLRWVDLPATALKIASDLPATVNLAAQQDSVTRLFSAADRLGLNTMRLFGHGDIGVFQLQTAPGVGGRAAYEQLQIRQLAIAHMQQAEDRLLMMHVSLQMA